jgi:hypothetical protein
LILVLDRSDSDEQSSPMNSYPRSIASARRDIAVEILEFEGAQRVQNRDARGYYFMVRLEPKGPESRVAVVFSGTVLVVKPEAFGLPDFGDRDTTFQVFAEAAIGDYLDDQGLPEFAGRGTPPVYIDCFSPHFQLWKDRVPATDAAVEEYLWAHVFHAWKFDHMSWRLGPADLLRLNVTLENALKIVALRDGVDWTSSDVSSYGVTLTPSASFLRTRADTAKVSPPPITPVVETPVEASEMPPATYVYVDESRIAELRALESPKFDLRKVLAICEELNFCYRSQCYHAVAALTRALIDHVPPVFGCRTFGEIANNYAGSRSFKDCARRLEDSARKVADSHLHTQIRKSEVLPNRVQVDYSNDIDVLLGELVRILQPQGGLPEKGDAPIATG